MTTDSIDFAALLCPLRGLPPSRVKAVLRELEARATALDRGATPRSLPSVTSAPDNLLCTLQVQRFDFAGQRPVERDTVLRTAPPPLPLPRPAASKEAPRAGPSRPPEPATMGPRSAPWSASAQTPLPAGLRRPPLLALTALLLVLLGLPALIFWGATRDESAPPRPPRPVAVLPASPPAEAPVSMLAKPPGKAKKPAAKASAKRQADVHRASRNPLAERQ